MTSTSWLILVLFLQSTMSYPQANQFILPNVDFSTAQEVNGLEPSAAPELQGRSLNNNGNFLEATLEEVQNILKASPDLPRLTKGEILDLIENITKQDMEKLRSLNKNRVGKAVMLVMPYSPKKNGENMEDLYTKTPITQLIDNDNTTVEVKKPNKNKKPSYNSKKDGNRFFGRDVTKTSYKLTFPTTAPTPEILYDTTSPMTTEATTVEVTTFRRRVRPPRTRPPSTTRPTRRRKRPTYPSPTNVKDSQDQSQIDKFLPENAVRVTRPPIYRYTRKTTTTTTEVPDLNIAESYQDYVYANPPSYALFNRDQDIPSSFEQQDELTRVGPVFKPISNQLYKEDDLPPPPTSSRPSFVIPEGFEHIFKNLNLDSPSTREKLFEESLKSNTVFPKTTTTTTKAPIAPMPEFGEVADNLSPDMRSLLMTFGLIPNPDERKKTRKEDVPYKPTGIQDKPESYMGFKPLPENGAPNEDLDSLLASFGLGRNARKSKKITKRVDTGPGLDLSVVPESMMGIVKNLGLGNEIPVTSKLYAKESTTTTESTKNDRIDDGYQNENVSAEDISSINDLPNEEPVENITVIEAATVSESPEGNSTLSETPIEKSTPSETSKEISTTEQSFIRDPELLELDEVVSTTVENLTDSDINEVLDQDESRKIENTETTTKGTSTSVVFNPTDQKIVQREKEQLDKLVELIKALKRINGSATEEDFKDFDLDTLREFTKVLNESQRTTIGEQIENEINHNNFDDIPKFKPKREEMSTEPSTTTTESEDITFNLEPNLLDESVGGLPEDGVETTTPRKLSSGFYYLMDWNSFLEVDNTKGTRVNLRLQPKVGDPSRFYAINND